MEDEWRQELQSYTNVPKESKNLDQESNVLNTTRFLEELEYQSTPVNFLEEKTDVRSSDVPRFATETFKLGRQRCGCLYKYLENKKLKDGTVASYPRVIGKRDPDNVKHWRWGFNWEEKIDEEWKNRSIGVPIGAVSMVIGMQNNNCSVNEIISFIKKSKAKSDKKTKDKNKKIDV